MKIINEAIIQAYEAGESMNSIAKSFGTYTTTVKRILEKNNVDLRHDEKREGSLYVKDGEKLIEWAKAQGRLVTKAELAEVLGRKRLSPSYFIKYPELGQYIKTREQREIQEYSQKLYKWLQDNNISYKPNDRTKLGLSISALLLEEYSKVAIDIFIKPSCISKKKYEENAKVKMEKAKSAGITMVFLNKEHFDDLNSIKGLLDSLSMGEEIC